MLTIPQKSDKIIIIIRYFIAYSRFEKFGRCIRIYQAQEKTLIIIKIHKTICFVFAVHKSRKRQNEGLKWQLER